jgi:hypothetical protein
MDKYQLIAQNKTGEYITIRGCNQKICMAKFDAQYKRTGFIIFIRNIETGETVKEIKLSYK